MPSKGMKENLTSLGSLPREQRVAIAKMGAKASHEAAAKRRTFKNIFEALLKDKAIDGSSVTNDELMAIQMIKEAVGGNVKAFEVVRDTVGEKPVDKQETKTEMTINNYKELTIEELKKLAGD